MVLPLRAQWEVVVGDVGVVVKVVVLDVQGAQDEVENNVAEVLFPPVYMHSGVKSESLSVWEVKNDVSSRNISMEFGPKEIGHLGEHGNGTLRLSLAVIGHQGDGRDGMNKVVVVLQQVPARV